MGENRVLNCEFFVNFYQGVVKQNGKIVDIFNENMGGFGVFRALFDVLV